MYNGIVTSTKEFTWDCAHLLDGHQGLCKNLHGHTYKMHITAMLPDGKLLEEGPSRGMVIDFKDLKHVVREIVVKKFDHATVINTTSVDAFEQDLHKLLLAHGKKVVTVNYRPTAENMVIHFLKEINDEIGRLNLAIRIVMIRLYETPTSFAEIVL